MDSKIESADSPANNPEILKEEFEKSIPQVILDSEE